MKRLYLSIVLFLALSVLSLVFSSWFTVSAQAQTSCQPIYGGGQTCVSAGNILVDKKVLNPETQKMIDNLTVNDTKFQPGSTITFQITLTNTGQAEIKHIDVKDVFPQYLLFTSGPGKFNVFTNTLAFEVTNLLPNETRVFTVVGKIADQNRLPIKLGIICAVNQTTVTTTDTGEDWDNTQFCIQKPSPTSQKHVLAAQSPKGQPTVFPAPAITISPATGGELIFIISLIPTAIAGFFLRKKAT